MANWNYQTVYLRLRYDRGTKSWVCHTSTDAWRPIIETYARIDDALRIYGTQGWELVSVVGVMSTADGDETYRAFFKATA